MCTFCYLKIILTLFHHVGIIEQRIFDLKPDNLFIVLVPHFQRIIPFYIFTYTYIFVTTKYRTEINNK